MKLLFKQRMFSWFDSYDIYDENENTVYVVKRAALVGALPENLRYGRERAGYCQAGGADLAAQV